jgi:hypothetical protein
VKRLSNESFDPALLVLGALISAAPIEFDGFSFQKIFR